MRQCGTFPIRTFNGIDNDRGGSRLSFVLLCDQFAGDGAVSGWHVDGETSAPETPGQCEGHSAPPIGINNQILLLVKYGEIFGSCGLKLVSFKWIA